MDILETIIRGVLIEAPVTKAKLRSFSSAELLTAKRATPVGAVFGYYAIVKGVKDEKTLLNAVAGATLGSQDSETRVGVGASGPYANGKFVYVVNTDDVQRKNVAAVWIIPNDPAAGVKPTTTLKIGQSPMISKVEYVKLSDAAKAANPNAQVADVSQMPENETKLQQIIDKGKDVLNIDGSKPADADAGIAAEKKPWEGQPSPQQAGYPYKWWNGQNMVQPNMQVRWDMVYTMSPTDEWVYWRYSEASWDTMKKSEFETTYWNKGWQDATRAPSYKQLNKKAAGIVEAKFGYGESSDGKYTKSAGDGLSNVNQNQNQNQNQGGNSGTKRKVGDRLQFVDVVGSKLPVYQYDSKTKKFVETAKYTIDAKSKMTYQGIAKSGEYFYVDLDGKKVWVNKKRIK
jgi:hypothetical protein